ncbi:MAG: 50S ribosomal protein L1 [Chlamydiae bacterium]|nr:50S ribosomal protein L1 [Chlamydiota bacterium]
MAYKTKRSKKLASLHDSSKVYDLSEAVEFLQQCPPVKFDQSIDLSIHLGVDPRKADQLVRGTTTLPHGTGQKNTVLVITKGDAIKAAEEAGADFAGHEEYLKKIQDGWLDFDTLVVTPDMMREIGKMGKVLGPRGLMPTPKAGTVTTDVAKAVKEIKAGKVEYKVDKNAVINNVVGKLSFNSKQLIENIRQLLESIIKAKPSSSKGTYVKSFTLSSTMGPGCKINLRELPI